MINELKAMAIFAEVIKRGSFRAASKVLNLSPSVVSYHISKLEAQVGAALIYRSTRKLSLTAQGEVFFKHIEQMLVSAHQGLDLVSSEALEPIGKISVTLPSSLAKSPLNQKIAQFVSAYPKVEINLSYSDNRENIIDKSIDLAIRAGDLADSSHKAKQIGVIERRLVCSHNYFKAKKTPKTIEDIQSWDWVALNQLPKYREFKHERLGEQTVDFNKYITVNSVEAMSHFCELDLGLATLAEYQVVDLIKKGKLIPVLPEWKVASIPLHALWPNNVYENSLVKRLLKIISS